MKTSEPKRLFKAQRVSRRSFDRFVMRTLQSVRRRRRFEREKLAERRDATLEIKEGTLAIGRLSLPVQRAVAWIDPRHRMHPTLLIKPRVLATAAAVRRVGFVLARAA